MKAQTPEQREARRKRLRTTDLSPRQLDVIVGFANGLSTKEVAQNLGLSPSTVDCHLADIIKKLGVLCRVQAVLKAERLGLLKEVTL